MLQVANQTFANCWRTAALAAASQFLFLAAGDEGGETLMFAIEVAEFIYIYFFVISGRRRQCWERSFLE